MSTPPDLLLSHARCVNRLRGSASQRLRASSTCWTGFGWRLLGCSAEWHYDAILQRPRFAAGLLLFDYGSFDLLCLNCGGRFRLLGLGDVEPLIEMRCFFLNFLDDVRGRR